MTEPSGRPASGPKHARPSRFGGRAPLLLGVVVAIVLAAAVVTWVVRSAGSDTSATGTAGTEVVQTAGSSTSGSTGDAAAAAGSNGAAAGQGSGAGTPAACPGGVVHVAAAPGIAEAIAGATAVTDSPCRIEVRSTEPADVVASGAAGIDVWVPDSSMWIARAQAAGLTVPDGTSVASSPVVFALSPTAAAELTDGGTAPNLDGILETRKAPTPIRVGLPDPTRSAAAVGAILAARAAVTGTSDARAALTWAVRSSPPGLPTTDSALLDRLASDPGTAVPVSEQAVVAHNTAAAQTTPAVAVYPGAAEVALDYPLVNLTGIAAGNDVLGFLMASDGQDVLQEAGFRAPDGTPGRTVTVADGADPAVRVTAPLPGIADVDDAIRQVQITNEPSRMLAVMDISGSMQAQVPGAGGADRMTLAKEAATRGLGLYGADSDIGLWVFSTNLTPTSDHRQLIPVSSLGPDGQGGTGAQRLAQALAGLQAIPDGGTGLYDTVLEAVRGMRAAWDPTKVNAVLLLTDGMNDDANGISLDTLLSALAAEQDPAKPVPVISIAFGPDSDVQSLAQISRATGGASYVSQDPRQIGEIFLDAVGQRLCRPTC